MNESRANSYRCHCHRTQRAGERATRPLRVYLSALPVTAHTVQDFVVGGLDHQPVDSIAATFASFGFNCIRLLWSVEAVTVNSVVRADRLSANPDLVGSTVLQVFDAVIAALGKHGLMVSWPGVRVRGVAAAANSLGSLLYDRSLTSTEERAS